MNMDSVKTMRDLREQVRAYVRERVTRKRTNAHRQIPYLPTPHHHTTTPVIFVAPQVIEENAKIAQSTLQHRDELEVLRAETLTLQVRPS
jgi:hypothetical protein